MAIHCTESQALSALSALAEPTRLRMLRYLVTRGDTGAAAGEVAQAVQAISSRASFHLATLARAGLVSQQRVSRQVIYRVNFAAMAGLVAFLVKDCCADQPSVVACCTPAERPGK